MAARCTYRWSTDSNHNTSLGITIKVLRSLHLTNLTLFQQAELVFSPGLNVLVGENGCGKTHVLKLAYAMAACLQAPLPTRTAMQSQLADKLVGVLRPESLGRLVRRRAGRERAELEAIFAQPEEPLRVRFASNSRREVVVVAMPETPLAVVSHHVDQQSSSLSHC